MTQYFPSTVRYVFDPIKGLIQEIAETSTVTFASGTIIEVSGVFAYVPEDPSKWSTVPTNLIQAIDYLAAGSGSGGGGGGGGTPGGSNGDIQYKVNATTFGGVNKIRFVGGNVFVTGSFLGDVVGTASYATNATSALTASYVLNAISSSFASSALTASYASNADLLDNLDSTAFARLSVGNTFTSNQVVSGTVTSTLGFSGSLTKLTDGTSYIKAGSNITVTTASNGSITIASTGGGGTISGSISANQIAYGTATNTISGSGDFTYDGSTLALNTIAPSALTIASLIDGQFLEVNSSLYSISLTDPLNPTNNLTLGPSDVGLGDGSVSANMYAGEVSVTDNGTTNSIGLSVPGGEATLKADDGSGALIELHLSASSLTMQSSVASGDFLTIDSNTQRLTIIDPGTGIDQTYLEGGRFTIDAAGNKFDLDAFVVPTITTLNVGSGLPMPLNLSIEALQINSDPGVAGYVLTSSGPGSPPGWALASFGGGSTIFTGSLMVYVDSVGGTDSPGNGTLSSPFRTINYAYSQVPSLGNIANTGSNASTDQFVREKLIFKLAPGRYTENVTLGFKRARVALVGNGVQIIGNVKMSVVRGDFPAASMEAIKGTFPSPWTSGSSLNTFEIFGENGAGVEVDASSNSIIITGLTSFAFEDATMPGFGLGTNWENNYGQFNFYVNRANLIGGMVMATNYTVPTTNGICTSVIEVDSCTIGESSSPIRTYFGVVPYAYLAAPLTWNTGSVGTTNKAPTGTITCKVHNSTMGAAIGPRLVIGEMDGNRIYDIDRTMLGTVDNGAVAGSTSTSYIGFVNNQFRIYSGAGIPTSSYQLGQATGTTRYKLDSVSYTTLAFSRNSSGVLSARTLNTGSGVSYDFLDEARSLAYTPVSSSFWTAPAPTTIQNAIDRLSAAVRGLLTGSIPG